MDLIFILGAPGTGKSTLAKALHQKLRSPYFEFGWIPEFREKQEGVLSYTEEEALSFANLVFVVKNYVKHGFHNVIVTDLPPERKRQLPQRFRNYRYLLITLYITDDQLLQARVLDETRSSGYRNWAEAIGLNQAFLQRPPLRNEVQLDSTYRGVDELVEEVVRCLHLDEKD